MKEPISNNAAANKRIARNSIFLSIRMVVVLGITFYTTRVVLGMLGVVDYGVNNVVCGFVSMLAFLNTSLSNGIQRFFNFELGKNGIDGARKVFNTSLLIQFILALIIIALTETIGLWYFYNKLVIPEARMTAGLCIFQFAIINMLFIIMQAPFTAAVMAHEKMDFFAIMSVIDAILKLAIVLVIPLFHGDNLIYYGLTTAIIGCLNLICYVIYSKIYFKEIKIEKKFHKNLFKEMLGFSGWNIFGSFSGIMKEQGTNLVLNLFFGPVVNAARGVAVQVNAGLQSFVTTITTPVRPQVIQSYAKGETSRTMNLTFSVSKLSCMFLYMMALPVIAEIDFILRIWLGKNIPNHTSSFVTIIILISFLNNLNGAVSGVVHASGRMKLYQLSTSSTALLCIPFSYIALSLGGKAELALWMVFVTMILAQSVALLVLKRIVYFRITDYLLKVIVPITIVALSTFWIPIVTNHFIVDGWPRLILNIAVCTSTVALSIFVLGLSASERQLIVQMIRNKIKR